MSGSLKNFSQKMPNKAKQRKTKQKKTKKNQKALSVKKAKCGHIDAGEKYAAKKLPKNRYDERRNMGATLPQPLQVVISFICTIIVTHKL